MKKLKKDDNFPIIVKNGSLKDFFARGRTNAKLIDQNKLFLPVRAISFEDTRDLARFLK